MKNIRLIFLFIPLFFALQSYSQSSYTVYPVPQKMTMGNQNVELSSVFNVIIEDGIHTTTIDRLKEVIENAGLQCRSIRQELPLQIRPISGWE